MRQNKPRRVIHDVAELPVLCDCAEAGLLLRRNPEMIAKMAKEGVLKGAKQGQSWFFRRDDLVEYMDKLFETGVHRHVNEDKNTFKPADFSDAGNAAVFVREHCDDIIFTDSMGWLCWDGKRWERNEHKALELAEDFSEHMLRDAMGEYRDALHNEAEAKAADPEGSEAVKAASEAVKRSKAYLAHANMTRPVSRLKAILDLARPYMVRPGNSMDADPLELNTQAGIINLVTGAFRPNQQEAYCTKVTAFSRNDKGKDILDSFLDTITCENSSLKGFLQMVVGMSLFGKVYQDGVTFAVGTGKNGKSTFFNTVAAVMGDYAGYIDIDVITTKNSNDKAALATLRGKTAGDRRRAGGRPPPLCGHDQEDLQYRPVPGGVKV